MLLAVPVLMASQEWDDHDRSRKVLARDLGIDYWKVALQTQFYLPMEIMIRILYGTHRKWKEFAEISV
jgi:hypothetical protein